MLTGDKLETAENIGYSCNLISSDFQKIIVRAEDDIIAREPSIVKLMKDYKAENIKTCLLLEGAAVSRILEADKEMRNSWVENILAVSDSVICCRVSPKEKADVVRIVKQNMGKITLAIGDGANDVNMIQEAHVGIGLYGKEGMRAVQSSDYALPEFKCLWRMLMCHGRWSYIRNAEMIIYFFYKNMVFSMPLLIWSFYTGYSGQTVYDDFYITFYNLAFTSWPLLIKALFDKDFDYKYWPIKKSGKICGPDVIGKLETKKSFVEWVPYLYYIGQQNMIYNYKNLGVTLTYSVMVGMFMMFVIVYSVQSCVSSIDGYTTDIWYMS
jgi:magnesium-transporting ATPase (P-type)